MSGHAEARVMARDDEDGLPLRRTDEEIAAAVADDPDAAPLRTAAELEALRAMEDARDTYGVARLRRRLGLAQVQFVNRYKVPLATLREWEHGAREPDAASRLLLAVIAEDPELVARVAERVGWPSKAA